MKTHAACSAIATMLLSLLTANIAAAQLASSCVENSPERRGEVGCSIIENKLLPDGLKEPLFWHIDRFDSAERARIAVGPTSVAFEAAGTSWLMTIESRTSDHHGGRHVAQVGPLAIRVNECNGDITTVDKSLGSPMSKTDSAVGGF